MELRVRQLRQTRGLSLAQLARQAGMSQSYLSQIERGDRRTNADLLQRLAAALDVEVAELLAPGRPSVIPVTGLIGVGGLISSECGLSITCPPFLDALGLEAFLFNTQSFEPIFVTGEAVVVEHNRTRVTNDRSRPVVCKIVGGELVFAQIVDGSREGLFTLVSLEPRPIERPRYDVELSWATPARAYLMPEDVGMHAK
ncbi:helix-turn-helix domain-containing protein [Halovulum sp. GXIMD14794]